MPHTVIISDGGVSALLAMAACSERLQGTQTPGVLAYVWCPDTGAEDGDFRAEASRAQADMYGLSVLPKQIPVAVDPEAPAGDSGFTLRMLLEAGLLVRQLGGGEVIWPVNAVEAPGGGPDVDALSRAVNQALLISQLVSLSGPRPTRPGEDLANAVRIRTPYADLTDRQIADLILDMDLPVWMCWFASAAEQGEGDVREAAIRERERWLAVLRQAGWAGSLESVKPSVVVKSPAVPEITGEAP